MATLFKASWVGVWEYSRLVFWFAFLVSGTGRRPIGYDYRLYHDVMSLHAESRAVVD